MKTAVHCRHLLSAANLKLGIESNITATRSVNSKYATMTTQQPFRDLLHLSTRFGTSKDHAGTREDNTRTPPGGSTTSVAFCATLVSNESEPECAFPTFR